ncbi:histidine phosphatase family protein [Thomasclavelia spiroformis]|uniref:histidine phosphatase family protein n=1 Tax=Thomasclavelia spiroformis TaxID=29348 RepID=UPI0026768F53|nr:histidine phosphatase family protein [Thomasclavelia spiroformis]
MRHANSYYNDLKMYAGNLDIPLSPKGIECALDFGKEFEYKNFDMVFVSEQSRSYETAILFLSQIKELDKIPIKLNSRSELDNFDTNKYLPIFSYAELNERDYGILQNKEKNESEKKFGKETIRRWRREFDDGPMGGEKFTEIVSRVANFYYDILLPYMHSYDVLIVAHQNSIRALYYLMFNVLKDEVDDIEFSNGQILHIHFDKNASINDSHPKNVIVMSAGKGKRMGKMTANTPKSLLDINGHTLIDYSLSFIAQNEQYRASIIYGHLAEKWNGIINKYHKYNGRIEFLKTNKNETYEKQLISSYLKIEKKSNYFIIYSADVLFDYRLFDVAISHHIKKNAAITVVLSKDKGRWKKWKYNFENDRIKDIFISNTQQPYERFFFVINKEIMDKYIEMRMTNNFEENSNYGEGACFMIKNLITMQIPINYLMLNDMLINVNDSTDFEFAKKFISEQNHNIYNYMNRDL